MTYPEIRIDTLLQYAPSLRKASCTNALLLTVIKSQEGYANIKSLYNASLADSWIGKKLSSRQESELLTSLSNSGIFVNYLVQTRACIPYPNIYSFSSKKIFMPLMIKILPRQNKNPSYKIAAFGFI